MISYALSKGLELVLGVSWYDDVSFVAVCFVGCNVGPLVSSRRNPP